MTESPQKKQVTLGKVLSPFGVRGWVHVKSFTEVPADLLSYDAILLCDGNTQTEYQIQHSQAHGQGFILKFAGIGQREEAEALKGHLIQVDKFDLPDLPAGDFYWHELVGLEVLNSEGFSFGHVKHLIETGANDVLVVNGTKEYLIPYLPDKVVLKVEPAERTILVDWEPDFL